MPRATITFCNTETLDTLCFSVILNLDPQVGYFEPSLRTQTVTYKYKPSLVGTQTQGPLITFLLTTRRAPPFVSLLFNHLIQRENVEFFSLPRLVLAKKFQRFLEEQGLLGVRLRPSHMAKSLQGAQYIVVPLFLQQMLHWQQDLAS